MLIYLTDACVTNLQPIIVPFLKLSGSVLHIVVMVLIRSNGKQIDFNQQKRGELTHYTLKISFCIPAIERFRKIIEVH